MGSFTYVEVAILHYKSILLHVKVLDSICYLGKTTYLNIINIYLMQVSKVKKMALFRALLYIHHTRYLVTFTI